MPEPYKGSSDEYGSNSQVIEVYGNNFLEEIDRIASLIEHYNYIAMVSLIFYNFTSLSHTRLILHAVNLIFIFMIRQILIIFLFNL